MNAPHVAAAPTREDGIARAIAAARAHHARLGVAKPSDLRVELAAAELDGYVVPSAEVAGDARVVRANGVALIVIAASIEGTPRARFSIAHELGHLLLHPDVDALARIHGLPRSKRYEFDVEREADAFASEWLLPHALFARMCGAARPILDDVADVARAFGTSLTATAKRWAELAPTACALVESKAGRVRHFTRSQAFRAKVVRRRAIEDGACVAETSIRAPHSVGGAWGGAAAGVEIFEQSVRVPDTDVVLTWLWHAPT